MNKSNHNDHEHDQVQNEIIERLDTVEEAMGILHDTLRPVVSEAENEYDAMGAFDSGDENSIPKRISIPNTIIVSLEEASPTGIDCRLDAGAAVISRTLRSAPATMF